MRGEPQSGFVSAIVRTSLASSEPTLGRPTRLRRDFQVQKARNPCRYQRITVWGRTTWSASRHPAHWWDSHSQKRTLEPPELRSLPSAAKQDELLPQRQVLESEVSAGSERRTQRAQQRVRGTLPPWLARRWAIVQDFGKRQATFIVKLPRKRPN